MKSTFRLIPRTLPRASNIRTTAIGLSFAKQTGLHTPLTAADMWRISKLNNSINDVNLNQEDDAAELGKGHEFATTTYKTAWDVTGQLDKYCSSQWLAWVFAFALGKTTVTSPAAGVYEYTSVPMDDVTDGIEQPAFHMVEKISALDRSSVGVCLNDYELSLGSGPSRANSKMVANYVGSGKVIEPSGIVIPTTQLVEAPLNATGAQIVMLGTDYIAAKSLVSLKHTFSLNMRGDSGYFPGSGTQDSADSSSGSIRGRMERGDRVCGLEYVVRYDAGSTEVTKMLAQTEGPASILMQGATISGAHRHSCEITFHRVKFRTAVIGDTDGLTTVAVQCSPLWHSTNGLMTVKTKTNVEGICSVEVPEP